MSVTRLTLHTHLRRGLFTANTLFPNKQRWLAQHQAMRHYIKEEKTPNPSAIKFIFPETVLPESAGTGLFLEKHKKHSARELARSPLAKKLLDCVGVQSVFLGRDFVTITKERDTRWQNVKPLIHAEFFAFETGDLKAIADVDANATDDKLHHDTDILETDSEVVAAIKELIETRVRPSVQEDGGDIFFVDFLPATGIVQVRLAGSCVGCPSSSVTLRHGVENMLMHYIPEVKGIEEVSALLAAESHQQDSTHDGNNDNNEELKLSFKPQQS